MSIFIKASVLVVRAQNLEVFFLEDVLNYLSKWTERKTAASLKALCQNDGSQHLRKFGGVLSVCVASAHISQCSVMPITSQLPEEDIPRIPFHDFVIGEFEKYGSDVAVVCAAV